MSSRESKNVDDLMGFQPSEPSLCANGCGFFGTSATMGLCSKCYRDSRMEEERAASAIASMEKLLSPRSGKATVPMEEISATAEEEKPKTVASNRCVSCNKKVGVLGFQCRCGSTFCGLHRYPEKHDCTFDFKGQGKEELAKANIVVKADKIKRRI